MHVEEERIRGLCTDVVYDRGQQYYADGRIRRIERFGSTVSATVQGSSQYDVTVEEDGADLETRCSCPYDGDGACKHAVAVLLAVAADPPPDESDHVETVLESVAADELRAFVRDAVDDRPELRQQFLARFGDGGESFETYRADLDGLFDEQTGDRAVITEAIDFSHWFDIADRYRDRGDFAAAATVYRALFETIDDNTNRIDAAYDHYAQALQSALDGYVDCILQLDLDAGEFDTYAGVLATRAQSAAPPNRRVFRDALESLEARE